MKRSLRVAPLHSYLAAPYDWPHAIARATDDLGGVDATIVLLSRLDPWVRDSLPRGLHVLDAVDSMRRSMEERARESSPLTRWLWRIEAGRAGRAEAEGARAYDRVVVVSEEDRAELGAVAISNGVAIHPLEDAPRAFDFGFWGRLAYFANADAVAWLVDEIWPAIRASRPEATLIIGGADAPARVSALHGREGITVRSPVDDMAALARSVRVALFPLRYGSGQSNKVLEAAEGGCAVVATRKAMRGLDLLLPYVSLVEDVRGFVEATAGGGAGAPLRDVVIEQYSRERTLARLREVAA